MCVVGSLTLVSRACTGLVLWLKLSRVQTTQGDPVLWNDCPISTGVLAMAPTLSPYFIIADPTRLIHGDRPLAIAVACKSGYQAFRTTKGYVTKHAHYVWKATH